MKWKLFIADDNEGTFQLDLEAETEEEQKMLRATLEHGGEWEIDPTKNPPEIRFLGTINHA
jgi:hypothetical protein